MHLSARCTESRVRDWRRLVMGCSLLILLGACAAPRAPENGAMKAPQTSDKSSMSHFQRGLAAMEEGAYALAERSFLQVVENDPALPGAYCNLALIQFNRERYADASEFVQQAIAVNPRMAEAYNLRAQIAVRQGAIKQAESDYLKALEIEPGYVSVYYNLALLYDIYYQDVTRAVEYYEAYLSRLAEPDEALFAWVRRLKGTLGNG